jgi:hypothetical protein
MNSTLLAALSRDQLVVIDAVSGKALRNTRRPKDPISSLTVHESLRIPPSFPYRHLR